MKNMGVAIVRLSDNGRCGAGSNAIREFGLLKLTVVGFWLFAVLLIAGCKGGNVNGNTVLGKSGGNSKVLDTIDFPYPEIPQMMTDKAESSRYYVTVFWDEYIKLPNRNAIDSLEMEDAYVNFVQGMSVLQSSTGDLHSCDQIEKNLFARADSLYAAGDKVLLLDLIKFSEKYLYDPNSPMLNEELYIPALESIIDLKALSDAEKMQYEYQLGLALKNRVGTKAADFAFSYSTPTGILKSSLYSVSADYTLIFFNNPDCPACSKMIEALKDSRLVMEMINRGKLKIIAIYIDKEMDLWKKNRAKYPEEWIYAYDHNYVLRDNSIYGIRAIPSFYLLNKEKKVLIKDAPNPVIIINYLSGLHDYAL